MMNASWTMRLAAAGLMAASGSAVAQLQWTGEESDDWFDAANWSGGVPTAAADSVRINTDDPNPAVIDGAAAETGVSFSVGFNSRGELSILNGGSLVSGTSAAIGSQSAGDGRVLISGADSSWQVGSIDIGSSGSGELEILAGGQMHILDSGVTSIGRQANGNGSITVSGAGSRLDFAGRFWLGHTRSGQMTISDGAQVTWAGTASSMAQAANSQGEILLTGPGSLLSGSRLIVGNGGSLGTNPGAGSLRVVDGATLEITGDGLPENNRLLIGGNSGGVGEVVVGGPSGEDAEPPGELDLRGGIQFNSGAGTLVFNHSGNLDLPFPVEGPTGTNGTGLIRVENGTTLFTGEPVDYTGSLEIDAGAVFGAGGQLGDVVNEGRLVASPGQSATLSIDGDYSHGDNAVLEVQFAPGPVLDRVEVSGEVAFSGGTIDVRVLPGHYGNMPLDGIYPVLTASGGISGALPQIEAASSNAFALFREDDTLYLEVFDQMMRDRFEE